MKDISTEDGGVFLLPEGEVSNLAWQAMAGVSFTVSPQATVDVFYRYFDGGKLQVEEGTVLFDDGTSAGPYTGARGELTAHEIMLSLRWTFDPERTFDNHGGFMLPWSSSGRNRNTGTNYANETEARRPRRSRRSAGKDPGRGHGR